MIRSTWEPKRIWENRWFCAKCWCCLMRVPAGISPLIGLMVTTSFSGLQATSSCGKGTVFGRIVPSAATFHGADLTSRMTNLLAILGQFLLIVNLPMMLAGRTMFNWWAILLLIIAPTVSSLVQLALSRTREYNADLGAAELTGDPEALASALKKMDHFHGNWLKRMLRPGYQKLPEASLLRTHPPTAERIRRLLGMRDNLPDHGRLEPRPLPVAEIKRPVRILARDPFSPRWHRNALWF